MNRCRHTLNRLIIMTASLLGLSGLETSCDKDHGDGPMCMYGCPEYFDSVQNQGETTHHTYRVQEKQENKY